MFKADGNVDYTLTNALGVEEEGESYNFRKDLESVTVLKICTTGLILPLNGDGKLTVRRT